MTPRPPFATDDLLFGEYQLAETFGVLRPEWLCQVLSAADMARWIAYYKYKHVMEKQAIEKGALEAEARKQMEKR